MKNIMKNQKGLTLVELLAVLVILAIIAAIAVPVVSNLISDSRDRATAAEALNIISAAKLGEATGTIDCSAGCDSAELADFIESRAAFETVTRGAQGWTIDGHEVNEIDGIDGTEAGIINFVDSAQE
ncbi:prepilin-type N-terminal cleavage/methylation domain-containing protein [Jeotgalibacillus soli]|uniref:Prepilin-type N-terminal cleavage/methylation domain-containing protein n=1 Tax=Jeotgalibacillus soli TaxID=889306 RepID=A0A0C2R2T9_9BACL|nr:prepilin-type N-terminal cleavage/methylation domain-containing protein [Jeotgalibacillus soli]KIL44565.1 hypothetical protein KP78_35290 [Jeotgalibacillus soli]